MSNLRHRPPAVGDVYESKDRDYEPDRRIRVTDLFSDGIQAVTVQHPRRPGCVGKNTTIGYNTLRSRWVLVDASDGHARMREAVQGFRRELLDASDTYRAAPAEPSGLPTLAASYAYTLAALIGEVDRRFGIDAAADLAVMAEQVISDGDGRNLNGDLRAASEAPEVPR